MTDVVDVRAEAASRFDTAHDGISADGNTDLPMSNLTPPVPNERALPAGLARRSS